MGKEGEVEGKSALRVPVLVRIKTCMHETTREPAKLCNLMLVFGIQAISAIRVGKKRRRELEWPRIGIKLLDLTRLFKYVNNLC